MFQRAAFDAVFNKTKPGIEPPSLFVADHDAQLQQLDARPSEIDNRLDQAAGRTYPSRLGQHVHPPEEALMLLLFALSNGEPGGPYDVRLTKGSEHGRLAEAVEKPSQRLHRLGLEGGAKSFRIVLQSSEPNGAVIRGVRRCQPTNLNLVRFHSRTRPIVAILPIIFPGYGNFMRTPA